jgi:hypothetical protein
MTVTEDSSASGLDADFPAASSGTVLLRLVRARGRTTFGASALLVSSAASRAAASSAMASASGAPPGSSTGGVSIPSVFSRSAIDSSLFAW